MRPWRSLREVNRQASCPHAKTAKTATGCGHFLSNLELTNSGKALSPDFLSSRSVKYRTEWELPRSLRPLREKKLPGWFPRAEIVESADRLPRTRAPVWGLPQATAYGCGFRLPTNPPSPGARVPDFGEPGSPPAVLWFGSSEEIPCSFHGPSFEIAGARPSLRAERRT